MNAGTTINQRDIVLIDVPYSDLSGMKKRPVLIISDNEHNSHNEDIICCAVTSNPRNYAKSIEISMQELEFGRLEPTSRIKATKIFALDKNNIQKIIARLNTEKSRQVVKLLNEAIEIKS